MSGREGGTDKLARPHAAHQAAENSCSSCEKWPSLGSFGGGPFTTALSCSKIVVHLL